jgi:hypothetical protein
MSKRAKITSKKLQESLESDLAKSSQHLDELSNS